MIADNGYVYQLLQELGFSDFASRSGEFLLGRPLTIVAILAVAIVVSRLASAIAHRWVGAFVNRSALPGRITGSGNRARTLAGVTASIVRVVVWCLALLLVIGQLGIDLGPFLAGASILGFALGFGAQSLVRDYLSGFFILAEDQFGVGDVVTLGDSTGTVEEVTLRVTRIRGIDGTVWFIPNGEIRKVGNAAKDWSRAIVDVALDTGTDVQAAMAVINEAISNLAEQPSLDGALLDAPEVLGVEDIGTEGTTVRIAARTRPDQRARVAREIRARVGARLRAEGFLTAKETNP